MSRVQYPKGHIWAIIKLVNELFSYDGTHLVKY